MGNSSPCALLEKTEAPIVPVASLAQSCHDLKDRHLSRSCSKAPSSKTQGGQSKWQINSLFFESYLFSTHPWRLDGHLASKKSSTRPYWDLGQSPEEGVEIRSRDAILTSKMTINQTSGKKPSTNRGDLCIYLSILVVSAIFAPKFLVTFKHTFSASVKSELECLIKRCLRVLGSNSVWCKHMSHNNNYVCYGLLPNHRRKFI